MFYISKISPLLFLFGLLNLLISLILKPFVGYSPLLFVSAVFGFIGSVLLGAMYQIIPNSQNRKLSYPQVSYLVTAGVVAGMLLFYGGLFKWGSLLLFLSYATFFAHGVLNIKNWMPVTVKFLAFSSLYLALSSLFLFLHFWQGLVPLQLALHTLTVGAMLNAVYGVELAWIPMLLMQTLNVKKAKQLFYMKQASTVLFLLSFLILNYQAIALSSLLELGVALYFSYLMYKLVQTRTMPAPLPYVVKTFFVALAFLPAGFIAGTFTAGHPQLLADMFTLHLDLMVYGFTAFTIFGGMAHLFPRIMWNWKFASAKGGNAPTVSELIDEASFPKFLENSLIAFILFLAVDSLFYPLNLVSSMIYLFILGSFFKITFWHFFKKLKEVGKDGDNQTP